MKPPSKLRIHTRYRLGTGRKHLRCGFKDACFIVSEGPGEGTVQDERSGGQRVCDTCTFDSWDTHERHTCENWDTNGDNYQEFWDTRGVLKRRKKCS